MNDDTPVELANALARLTEVFNETSDRKLRKQLREAMALLRSQLIPPPAPVLKFQKKDEK